MIAPIWLRPRVGPYLRRERDKREYFKLFSNTPHIGEPRRSWLLLTGRRLAAETLPRDQRIKTSNKPTIAVFRNAVANNFETFFEEVKGRGPMLHEALRTITRPRYRERKYIAAPFIALHVRLGDFQNFDPKAISAGRHNHSLPITWYCEALQALRNALGCNARALVFS
ncbi:MAG TPA: hypothetical protein DD979_13100, partial [Gammaproteobacteria bacterium]|nr:hypothetical protein [Gammaproteobacteria bacterium]